MTPNEITAAIAETQGFLADSFAFQHPERYLAAPLWAAKYGEKTRKPVPSYYESLDAIVPVVRAMAHSETRDVTCRLFALTGGSPALATPDQWCEAYLTAKKLWK